MFDDQKLRGWQAAGFRHVEMVGLLLVDCYRSRYIIYLMIKLPYPVPTLPTLPTYLTYCRVWREWREWRRLQTAAYCRAYSKYFSLSFIYPCLGAMDEQGYLPYFR